MSGVCVECSVPLLVYGVYIMSGGYVRCMY